MKQSAAASRARLLSSYAFCLAGKTQRQCLSALARIHPKCWAKARKSARRPLEKWHDKGGMVLALS
jgi:hypothetical protein